MFLNQGYSYETLCVSIEFPSIIHDLIFWWILKMQRFVKNEKLKTLEKLKTILLFFVRDFPSLEAFVVHSICSRLWIVSVVKLIFSQIIVGPKVVKNGRKTKNDFTVLCSWFPIFKVEIFPIFSCYLFTFVNS